MNKCSAYENEPTWWSCLDQGSSRAQPRSFAHQSLRSAKEADIVVSYWSPRMFLPCPSPPSLTFTSHGTVHRRSNLGSQRRIVVWTPAVLCWGKPWWPECVEQKGLFNLRGLPGSTLVWPWSFLCLWSRGQLRAQAVRACAVFSHILELSITSPSSSALPWPPLVAWSWPWGVFTPQKVAQATDQALSLWKLVFWYSTMPGASDFGGLGGRSFLLFLGLTFLLSQSVWALWLPLKDFFFIPLLFLFLF